MWDLVGPERDHKTTFFTSRHNASVRKKAVSVVTPATFRQEHRIIIRKARTFTFKKHKSLLNLEERYQNVDYQIL